MSLQTHKRIELDAIAKKNLKAICTQLRLLGINVIDESWGKGTERFIALFLFVLYQLYLLTSYHAINAHLDDLTFIVNCLGIFTIGFQASGKVIGMVIYRKEIREMLTTVTMAWDRYLLHERHYEISLKYMKYVRYIQGFMFTCFTLTSIMMLSTPFVMNDFTLLPLPYYFPMEPHDQAPYYEINYIYQGFMMVSSQTILFGVDTLMLFFILHACSLIDILKYNLTLLGQYNNQIEGVKGDKELLRCCHMLHLEIVEYMSSLNNIYKMKLLGQLFSSLLIFAMLPHVIVDNIFNVTFGILCSAFTQLFFYCLIGELLKSKSGDILANMYENYWYQMAVTEQKSLVIMMSNAQLPLVLTVGGFADLSLMTFVTVLKTSYSYFTVLRD